jgi:DeoR/GlpR family transcriptional regulator of sugar metabolism
MMDMARSKSDPSLGAARSGPRVPASVRRARLAEIIGREGFVSVAGTADLLGVSAMTIRRDLEALESRGLLMRTHGGAIAPEMRRREVFDAEEPVFERRRRQNAAAKGRIAAAAARLIGAGETLALDVGTSVLALASALVRRAGLRIFTNSLPTAITLTKGLSPVYLLGGQLRAAEMAVIGPVATQQAGAYYFDRLFLGVSGVTETGFYDYSLEDTEVKQAFIARARQVVVLCDASKFGHRALARVCGIEQCHLLITDAPPPPHLAEIFRAAGLEVAIAGTPSAEEFP